MGDKTGIAWTDATWNPLRGCTMVSDGCANCYAMAVAGEASGPGQAYEGLTRKSGGRPVWTGRTIQVLEKMDQPLRWQRPRMVFVNSTSDLFHEDVEFEFIASTFAVMAAANQHTFQVLTKRPERMLEFFEWLREQCWPEPISHDMLAGIAQFYLSDGSNGSQDEQFWRLRNRMDGFTWPLPNVWLGVSVENQRAADKRIPLLAKAPAAIRFLSCEPLLGPVIIGEGGGALSWVIVGGESGPDSRPMKQEWAESLYIQCCEEGTSFFFKQMGEVWAREAGTKSRKGEDLDEVPDTLRVREYPNG